MNADIRLPLHLFSTLQRSHIWFQRCYIEGIRKRQSQIPFLPSGSMCSKREELDFRRLEAVARLATAIVPVLSNCYIPAPTGDSMWRGAVQGAERRRDA